MKKKKKILIISIFCLLLLVGGGITIFVLISNNKNGIPNVEEVSEKITEQEVIDNVESEDEELEETFEEVSEEAEEQAKSTTHSTTKTTATKKASSSSTTKTTKTTAKVVATKCEPFRPQDIPSDVIWYKLWDPYKPGDAWAELDIRTELTKLNPNMKALTDYDIYNHSTWGGYVSVECANMPGYYYGAYWIIGLDSSPNYSEKCSETSSPDCLDGKAYVKPDGSIYWVWKITD